MRIKNPKNIVPPPLPSLWANFIPYSLLPSPQQCRECSIENGRYSQFIACCPCLSVFLSSCPTPARDPSNGGDSFMNFSNASCFHRVQFFMNCSSAGHCRKVQFSRNRLLHSSIVAHGATNPANTYVFL